MELSWWCSHPPSSDSWFVWWLFPLQMKMGPDTDHKTQNRYTLCNNHKFKNINIYVVRVNFIKIRSHYGIFPLTLKNRMLWAFWVSKKIPTFLRLPYYHQNYFLFHVINMYLPAYTSTSRYIQIADSIYTLVETVGNYGGIFLLGKQFQCPPQTRDPA